MISEAFDVIDAMSAITRYSQAHNNTRESVLEHTGFVAIFGAAICARIDRDPSEVLKRAIVHDIDEIVTGDIPTTTKYANPEVTTALQAVEAQGADEAINKLFTTPNYMKAWVDAKDDSLNGWIIRIADTAAVIFKMRQEAALGNKTLLAYRKRVRDVLATWYNIDLHYEYRELLNIVRELIDILEGIK